MKKLVILMVLFALVGVVAPPRDASAARRTVNGAFQTFEHGYMIWFGDTGEILVLANSGALMRFPESVYAGLPDNPQPDTSPDGLVYPVSGFGRVWGNFANARNILGWGREEEFAYSTTLEIAADGSETILSIPDGRDIRVRQYDWSFVRTTPRSVSEIPVTAQIPITYQAFEGGYMMWWSSTGSIWVLYNDGQSEYFSSQRYGGLSENPIQARAPYGRFVPIQGFGKVWGHFPHVRNRLGWGTGWVYAHLMDFERFIVNPSTFYGLVYFRISFPTGREVVMTDRNTWHFVD